MTDPLTLPGPAVVTGAGRGLGLGITSRLAHAGHPVVLAGRRAAELHHAATALEERGFAALAVPTDVTDPAQVAVLADATREAFGPAALVVNNAGALPVLGTLDTLDWVEWRRGIDVDVRGLFTTTQAFLPQLRGRGGGTIVALAAARGGTASSALHTAVSPAQAALVSLARCLRAWLAPEAIAVHCLYPQLTLAGDVGRSAAAAFGAVDGVTGEEWIAQRFPEPLDPGAVGDAVAGLAREPRGADWEVGAPGLRAVDSDEVVVRA